MKTKSIASLVGAVIAGIFAIWLLTGAIVFNGQGNYLFMQYPNGNTTFKTNPGPYLKWWAHTEEWRQVVTVSVGAKRDVGSASVPPIMVQFNDFGKANITGLVRIELPRSIDQLKEIRRQYASGYEHFVDNGVNPVVKNAFTLSANLRGAQDAAQTLALLQQDIVDQLMNGIYVTKSVTKIDTVWETNGSERVPKIEKKILTEIIYDDKGLPRRTPHILQELGCRVTSCQIDPPDFDEAVEKAVQMRREAALRTDVAKQEALKAQQEAITAEANGRAAAMKAKWEQETIKATDVTIAEKDKAVAELAVQTANLNKQKLILEGQGEAEKKRLVMQANGALEQKLEAWIESQKVWADAFSKYTGAVTPQIVTGGSSGSNNAALNFMELIGMKAAKDLSLDMKTK